MEPVPTLKLFQSLRIVTSEADMVKKKAALEAATAEHARLLAVNKARATELLLRMQKETAFSIVSSSDSKDFYD